MNKGSILDALQEWGIVRVEIPFEGGHDSGGETGYDFFDDKNECCTLTDRWSSNGNNVLRFESKDPIVIDAELLTALAEPIYDKYYGFNNEPYVDGKCIWDVKERTITLSGTEQFTASEDFDDVVFGDI